MTQAKPCGSIELFIGPMFSGKTTRMLAKIDVESIAQQNCLVVKYAGDDRYDAGDDVVTHAQLRQSPSDSTPERGAVRIVRASNLSDVQPAPDELIVGIDEGQFYPDLVARCEAWAFEGRRVVVAALDGDSAREAFGDVCRLVPLCEKVKKLRGVCMRCRQPDCAAFTVRHNTASTDQILIGGKNIYRSVCRNCLALSTT